MNSSVQRLFRTFLFTLVCLPLVSYARQGEVQVQPDVAYGEAGGQKLLLDVYRPASSDKVRPAVVIVHGGGWAGGDKAGGFQKALGNTLAKAGYVCFSINYRLVTANANKYPAQIDDVQRAVRWVRAHAAQYGIDPNRVGAIGESAGGHLVALLGTTDARDNDDPSLTAWSSRVNCVVDLFGPTDFTARDTPGVSPVAVSIVVNFLGKKPDEAPDLYREASPIAHIDRNTVPFLIFHGTADPLVPIDQSQRLYDALKKAGIEATFTKVENEGHGFQGKEAQEKTMAETRAFFDKHLKPEG